MRTRSLCFALALVAVGCGAQPLSTSRSSMPTTADGASVAPALASSASAPATVAATRASATNPSLCAPSKPRSVKVSTRSGSSVAIAETSGRRVVYVADEDNRAVHVLDADGPTELAVTELPGRPAQILPLPDGRVLVTLRDKNRIAVLEPSDKLEDGLELRCERPTYTEPFGISLSADGSLVAVTAGWDHKLMLLNAADLEMRRAVDLPAEPRGVLLSSDGETAYIAHMIGGVVSSVSLSRPDESPRRVFLRPAPQPDKSAKSPKNADAKAGAKAAKEAQIDKAQELAAGQGFALAEISLGSSDGRPWPSRVLVPMASSDPMRFSDRASFPGIYGGRGGPAVIGAFVAVYDPASHAPLGGEVAPLREARPEDCILPRGIAVHNDRILVTCLGINAVVELDARSVDPITAERRRFTVGPGPTGVAVDAAKERALVFSQWTGELFVIDLREVDREPTRALRLAKPAEPALSPKLARGRELFHVTRDVRISFDGRACASCHPDGRADGLTWATPDGPRQTISLAGRVTGTGPFGWFGDHPTAKNHVTFTVGRLGGQGFTSDADQKDLDALIDYIGSMQGPSRDGSIADTEASALRERGRALFYANDTGCSTCHLEREGDGKRHDVGSGDAREKRLAFDTPALRFVAGSGPYFHDGRYATLIDLIRDPASKMGRSSQLSADDQRALVAYLESL